MAENKAAMSIDEFCSWASIGRNKAYEEIRAGRLRIRKAGRRSLITMTDALEWLENLPVA